MNKVYVSIDLGLTGFISIIEEKENKLYVKDSFKIEVEEKSKFVYKVNSKNKSKAIIQNQASFDLNLEKITKAIYFDKFYKKEIIFLFEQITSRPGNSAISAMSLADTSAVFRSIASVLKCECVIIPPATWKASLSVDKNKETSKKLFEELISNKSIEINQELKFLTKKVKNHNQVESILIAYFMKNA